MYPGLGNFDTEDAIAGSPGVFLNVKFDKSNFTDSAIYNPGEGLIFSNFAIITEPIYCFKQSPHRT